MLLVRSKNVTISQPINGEYSEYGKTLRFHRGLFMILPNIADELYLKNS